METPKWGRAYGDSPHHPFGAKGIGELATVGAPTSSTRWWTRSRTLGFATRDPVTPRRSGAS
jgi:hypothetical protein